MNNKTKKEWDEYVEQELLGLTPIITKEGYELDTDQPHLSGERYLHSGKKLVLSARKTSGGARAIIKASSHESGKKELVHEHGTRSLLDSLPFAYDTLLTPIELKHAHIGTHMLTITQYLEQEHTFLERPLKEQFMLVLRALEAQEAVHATTYGHSKQIRGAFGIWGAKQYLNAFTLLKESLDGAAIPNEVWQVLSKATDFFEANTDTVEQYSGFLTHTDFVPHNLRVAGKSVYLLDHTSLMFGNKHESWARFCNFMSLYNPPLTAALLQYMRDNRSPEEYLSLRLMRVYKLMFLISFYTNNLNKTTGELLELTRERILFWSKVLASVLEDRELSDEVLQTYKQKRDILRSEEEKKRQQNLH